MKDSKVSFFSTVKEVVNYVFNNNEKFIKWGPDNHQPFTYIKLYETVVEHSSSINFILNKSILSEVEEFDYWTVKKLALDYLVLGGFAVEVIKTRGGGHLLNYIDISKLRYSPNKKKLGYSDKWLSYKAEVKWSDVSNNINEPGIFLFKSPLSRYDYPTPHWFSAMVNLKTMSNIIEYHNNNSENGFTPSVIISFNNGEPDEDTKRNIQKSFEEKFTGVNGKKYMLIFNDSKETAATIDKLEADNLDERFSELQKFIQNQIVISHQITSPQLIGIKADNQGFSKTEYMEAMEIFKENVIKSLLKELEYAFSKLFIKEVKMEVPV